MLKGNEREGERERERARGSWYKNNLTCIFCRWHLRFPFLFSHAHKFWEFLPVKFIILFLFHLLRDIWNRNLIMKPSFQKAHTKNWDILQGNYGSPIQTNITNLFLKYHSKTGGDKSPRCCECRFGGSLILWSETFMEINPDKYIGHLVHFYSRQDN